MGLQCKFWRAASVLVLLAAFGMEVEAFIARQSSKSRYYGPSSHQKMADGISSDTTTTKALWTVEELESYSQDKGVVISFTTMGPGYRAVARAKHDESLILGYVEGFVRPTGRILHLDKMEVYKPMVQKAKRQVPDAFDFGGISFGVGLLMGYRCLLHGMENGCSIAEFLAIDDEEFQHKRLVRYYKRVGFNVVKYVGEDLKDVPDRLVWGGVGTLMKEEIDILTRKWADLLSLMKQRSN